MSAILRAEPRKTYRNPATAADVDARFRDSVRQLTKSLRSDPTPRWRYESARREKYWPWRGVIQMIDGAIERGAPLDDVLPFALEFVRYARSRFPSRDSAPLLELVRQETAAESAADLAEISLANEAQCPGESCLARAEDALARHREAVTRLLARIEMLRRRERAS